MAIEANVLIPGAVEADLGEFRLIPGPKGDPGEQGPRGYGIESAVLNPDYTLTLKFEDGTSYTTPVIRGEDGVGVKDVRMEQRTYESRNYSDTVVVELTDGKVFTFQIYNRAAEYYDLAEEAKNGAVTAQEASEEARDRAKESQAAAKESETAAARSEANAKESEAASRTAREAAEKARDKAGASAGAAAEAESAAREHMEAAERAAGSAAGAEKAIADLAVEARSVEASESAGVTKTTEDGHYKLSFSIPRGYGISEARLNEDYTLTLVFDDGRQATLGPIRGEAGETPKIGLNGDWYLGDTDTGVAATQLVDENTGRRVRMWFGTVSEYNALGEVDPDVYYNLLEGEP